MPLTFHPEAGTIVICDFSGFVAPEMIKVRPVVIISPRRRAGGQLVTIVPLSSTAPRVAEPWHHRLSATAYPPARGPMWAKADIVLTISLGRLDRVKVRLRDGSRTYQIFSLEDAELKAIRAAVSSGLGLT